VEEDFRQTTFGHVYLYAADHTLQVATFKNFLHLGPGLVDPQHDLQDIGLNPADTVFRDEQIALTDVG